MDGLKEVYRFTEIKRNHRKQIIRHKGAQYSTMNIVFTIISYLNEGAFSKVQQ